MAHIEISNATNTTRKCGAHTRIGNCCEVASSNNDCSSPNQATCVRTMTVQYNQDVLTGGPVVFLRLLLRYFSHFVSPNSCRWKGCVIKLIYIDFIVFMLAYGIVSCVYRFSLSKDQQRQFESVVLYVFDFQKMIPISFILGFYVQLVFSRFWQQFNTIPWVFTPALALIGAVQGEGRARVIRRTCVRYMNASLILSSARLHVSAKKRFPTTQHLVQAGKYLRLSVIYTTSFEIVLFILHKSIFWRRWNLQFRRITWWMV